MKQIRQKHTTKKVKVTTRTKTKGLGDMYRPSSKGKSLQVDTPDSMSYEIHQSLERLKAAVGNVDTYVQKKLGYSTEKSLLDALSAEQIDAAALAIYNIEIKGQGIIIGDQTGIGKGRIAAAMIRYGVEQGNKPIFITEKPNLFSDLYRDLKAIGSGELRPFIVNSRESKTQIKNEDGVMVYEAPEKTEQDKIIKSASLPRNYDFIMLTYSQISVGSTDSKGEIVGINPKVNFVRALAQDNVLVMDEAHNAAGESNTGKNLQEIVARTKGVTFLSATFAKRPDNMPIYAMKTAMSETNLDNEGLAEAIRKGGVALQEVLASQLVGQGQMIRRERSYEGIEVNYLTTEEHAAKQKATADAITEIMRDIIGFQEEYIQPEIKQLNRIVAAEQGEVKERKGTSKAGVDNAPYFSKVFQAINQMLFAVKAEAVAERAIMRLKQGKKPVIAFSNTMGSFLESLENENGLPVGDGDRVSADFATVLIKGLDGVLRYTIYDAKGNAEHKMFELSDFSHEAQLRYKYILQKINRASTGIVISPIDLIKQKIQEAGYSVAEVTGRKYELRLEERNLSKEELAKLSKVNSGGKGKTIKIPAIVKQIMPVVQQKVVVQSQEYAGILNQLEKQVKAVPKLMKQDGMGDKAMVYLHYFYGGSDWYITEWDGKDALFGYAILNDAIELAELGYMSVKELTTTVTRIGSIELDFHWRPKTLGEVKQKRTGGLGKLEQKSFVGTILNRKRENTNDAFRRFNDNEVDVLMINQSGSTGASAHAIPTKKVPASQVKQRVMIVLQAELDINTEVQKRGRINRTGQLIKPIYDYVTCAVPAEKRLMMMLQKKLKSLDANTTSNQKNSEAILKSDDFLNKYGDVVVLDYLKENLDFTRDIGDPLGLLKSEKDSGKERAVPEDAAHRVSGRVAVLPTKDQEEFYDEIIRRYHNYVEQLIEQDEYDLEVETMDLQATLLDKSILVVNATGGKSPFSDHTYLERVEVNVLKKPFSAAEVEKKVAAALNGTTPQKYGIDLSERASGVIAKRLAELIKEEEKKYVRLIKEIFQEKGYLKLDLSTEQQAYKVTREGELNEAKEQKFVLLKSKYDSEYEYLKDSFQYFTPGRKIFLPNDAENITALKTMGVVVGFKIGSNKKNQFAPSNLSIQIVLASSKKQITIDLGAKNQKTAYAIRGASPYFSPALEQILSEWKAAITESSKDRNARHIATGNLLQFYGQDAFPKAKLVQFTTADGKIRKGALLSEAYKPTGAGYTKEGEQKIIVPLSKCVGIIKRLSYKDKLECSHNLVIMYNGGGMNYRFIVPASRQSGGHIYLDPDVLQFVVQHDFRKVSNQMMADCQPENLEALCEIFTKKLKVNAELTQAQFDLIQNEFTIKENLGDEIKPVEPKKQQDNTESDLVKAQAEARARRIRILKLKFQFKK